MLVIEPHADDAFLSLGQTIEDWRKLGGSLTILTVYSGTRKRARDAQAYARAVGAEWIGLGAVEAGNARVNGAAPFEPLGNGIPFNRFFGIFLPLGVGGHPEHILVYTTFRRLFQNYANVRYYVDQPYACKQKNAESLNARIAGMRIHSVRKPGARKWRHIPLFKDQAKFFHFNPVETLRETFEMIVGE